MKKIFLLLALTAMLVCLFAISASAATPNTEGESVTLDDGTVCPIWDTDGDALIWYKSTANTADGYENYDYVKAQDSSVVDFFADGSYKAAGGTYYNEVTKATINGDNMKNTVVVVNLMDPDVKITSGKKAGGTFNGFKDIFWAAKSLEYAYFPETMVAMMKNAMCGCSKLKYVNFEDLVNLEELGETSFSDNPMLFANTTLDLSKTKIATLGTGSIAKLYMTELKLPQTLKTVNGYAWQYSYNLTRLDLPSSITSFSNNASFRDCDKLETVTGFGRLIENKIVKGFGNYMFNNCKKLKNVDGLITDCVLIIPEGFTSIGSYDNDNQGYVFANCDELVYVEMPSTLIGIGRDAFNGCDKLKLVSFDKVNAKVKAQIANGEAYTVFTFRNCSTFQGCTSLVALTIPEGTETAINRIVYGCTSLEAVYLPSTLKKMGTNGNTNGPFDDCKKMYFVEECFTVGQCMVDGEFDFTKFSAPQKPSVYQFPASFEGFIGHVRKEFGGTGGSVVGCIFRNCTGLNDVLVFGANFNYISSVNIFNSIGTASSPKTVVFLGDIQGAVTLQNAKYVTFMFANKADKSLADIGLIYAYKDSNNTSSYMYFCSTEKKYSYATNSEISNADALQAFISGLTAIDGAIHIDNPKAQGNRVVSGATCTDNEKVVDICFCGKTFNEHYVEGTALGHDEVVLSIEYQNGFTVNGFKHVCCERDNCKYENNEAVSAIFTGFLYATREEDDGVCGLVFTYEINNEALAQYESFNKTEIVFGALSVAEHNLSSTSPIGTDGKANQDKVVRAQLSGTGINHVDYIIRGSADAWNAVFNQDTGATIKDVKFYILGYVIENGSLDYFYGEASSEDITALTALSYNDIKAM